MNDVTRKVLSAVGALLAVCVLAFPVAPRRTKAGGGGGPSDPMPPADEEGYEDFYNYLDGRANENGTLTISNSSASRVLLFASDVVPENYIGTAGGKGQVKVKLPEQKFYTIVAVDKANWEEKGSQAAQ
ncbi:MAG: hypothetical protein MdMp014T_1456 [Treponematales bacterium]